MTAYYFIAGAYWGGFALSLCLSVAGVRQGSVTSKTVMGLMFCIVTWPLMAMQCLMDEKEEP